MTDIYTYLESHEIPYQKFEHPAVFTCDESKQLCPDMPGVSIKNLFLVDKNDDRYFLVVVACNKSVDLKKLRPLIAASSKLTFGSPEKMKEYLGVEPGPVTMLGLIHDVEKRIKVYIDEKIWGQSLGCHPLVNTATLVISPEGLTAFFEKTGHSYKVIDIPERIVAVV